MIKSISNSHANFLLKINKFMSKKNLGVKNDQYFLWKGNTTMRLFVKDKSMNFCYSSQQNVP